MYPQIGLTIHKVSVVDYLAPVIYDIYHDECKEDGYWHGFFFVPRDHRDYLLSLLLRARENAQYQHRVHYVGLSKTAKPHHEKYIVAEAWTSIGCAALQQQKFTKCPPVVLLGKNPRQRTPPEYRVLTKLLQCKFVLFRENDKHRNMYEGMTQLQCIETTFRMAIKGGIHKLFSEQEPIEIGNVFIDGDEHYVGMYKRRFSIHRTLQRFARERRSFVSFVDGPMLIPQNSDHNKELEMGQDPNDSHLLQLCDVLIGGFRFHSCFSDRKHPRYDISIQCKELLSHEQGNQARMAQSRYFNGFTLQQAWIEHDEWNFAPLVTATRNVRYIQPSLLLGAPAPTLGLESERQEGE